MTKSAAELLRRHDRGYAATFVVAFLIAAYIQYAPTFLDPDSFYHAKMALLLIEHGIQRDFGWLPLTTLAQNFADHHFLYHVFLVPFMFFGSAFIGLKIATALFSALAITAFYALLRSHGVRWPFWFSVALATSAGFIGRLNLAKTSALSIAVLMLALVFVRRGRVKSMFALAWAYVWAYGGWPLLAVVAVVALVARAVERTLRSWHPAHGAGLIAFARSVSFDRLEVRMFAAVFAGLATGVVVNPFFPANIRFYWEQIVQIAILNYGGTIRVGTEWYPSDLITLVTENGVAFLIFLGALTILLVRLLQDKKSGGADMKREALDVSGLLSATGLSGAFLVLALLHKRHVEYFIPFLMYLNAILVNAVVPEFSWRDVWAGTRRVAGEFGLLPVAALAALPVMFVLMSVRDVRAVAEMYRGGLPFTKYERASKWLAEHAAPGSLIFHSDWDDFPPLFYWNDRVRYVSGLDPTFFYRADPLRYWQWVHITTGKRTTGLAGIVRDGFRASYVLIEKDHKAMRAAIEGDPAFKRVYFDDETDVFSVK